MNFILEQILYMIILFITNPCKFYSKLKKIETLPFGREVKKIEVKDGLIYKYYRIKSIKFTFKYCNEYIKYIKWNFVLLIYWSIY